MPLSELSIGMYYVVVPCQKIGQQLIEGLLHQKLIACGTIIPHCISFFWWKDAICQANECVLWIKTSQKLCADVAEYIKKNHPYELPFMAFFAPHTSLEIEQWIKNSTVQSMMD
jgi:uncharacterized protein involved in tolerance to divalent cations